MLRCEIIGNLGADAEIQKNNDGSFISMNVAHSRKYTDRKSGEIITDTKWVSVSYNNASDQLFQYLKKGVKIYARGRLDTRIYRGHDGQNHAGINIYANEIELCGGPNTKLEDDSNKPF